MSKKRSPMHNGNHNLELIEVEPLTERQGRALKYWEEDKHLILQGYAGTGKTFLALSMALKLLDERNSPYKKVIVVRSAVPSRDMGFMPGNQKEKSAVYEEPYFVNVNQLYRCGSAYETLKKRNQLDFRTTSYMRGMTYDRSVVIVDEIQNMSFGELDTIMTRIGENSRIIFCGDYRQTDLKNDNEKKGLGRFLNILNGLNQFAVVDFQAEDIVRSDIVRDYIIAKTES